MGKTTEAAWHISLQYASNEIKHLECEIRLMENIILSVKAMEVHKMICVESSEQAKTFQAYKGAIAKFSNYRKEEKKRQSSHSAFNEPPLKSSKPKV